MVLMVQISIYQSIAAMIFVSLTLVFYFLREAKKMDGKADEIIVDKNRIIDGSFLKSVSIISLIMYRRMIKQIPSLLKIKDKDFIKTLTAAIGEVTSEITDKSDRELEQSVEDMKIPKELSYLFAIREEDRDRLIDLSVLTFFLTETVPSAVGRVIDRMTKAIVCGFFCGLFLAVVDLLFSYELIAYLPLLGMLIFVSGAVYINFGIFEIWRQRTLEKRLKKLEKAKGLEEIRESVGEIVEYAE